MAGRIAYYGNIATQGLVLDLDAAIQGSYPKTGSTWFDISNNGNNGTLTNGPLYTGSDYGAIRFDGVDDFVRTTNQPLDSVTTAVTYTSWYNITDLTVRRAFFSFRDSMVAIKSNGFDYWWNVGAPEGSLIANIITGSWSNMAITQNGTVVNLYVNGAPASLITGGTITTFRNAKAIGQYDTNPGAIGKFLGSIANAQIYNQALTQFQVWQNFNAYKSRYGIPDIVTDGLVLNLDAGNPYSYLSGSSGTTWTNTVAVSSSISGTLVNGPVYSNGAITFDGVNDYVQTNFNVNLDEQNMSICFFFKNLTTADWTDFISLITTTNYSLVFEKGGDNGFPLTNGYLKVYPTSVSYTSSLIDVSTPGFFVQNSNIHYIVLTTSPSQWNLYSENGLYASGSVSGSTNYFNKLSIGTDFARIGGYPRYSKCSMYTVQVYNRGLTSTEVQQNFNALRGRYGI